MTLRIMVEVTGNEKLDILGDIQDEFAHHAKDAIGAAADILLADVKRRLRARRGPAAAPAGEAPAFQSGDLEKSYKRIAPRVQGQVASSGIRSKDPGANRVENGVTDERGIRTLPHPAVRPAIVATAAQIDALLQDRLG